MQKELTGSSSLSLRQIEDFNNTSKLIEKIGTQPASTFANPEKETDFKPLLAPENCLFQQLKGSKLDRGETFKPNVSKKIIAYLIPTPGIKFLMEFLPIATKFVMFKASKK